MNKLFVAVLPVICCLGCRSALYEGPGKVETVRSWSLEDAAHIDTRSYVNLTNFSMADPFRGELIIQRISAKTAVLQLRFETTENWTLNKRFFLELAPKYGLKMSDLNLSSAILKMKVTDSSGITFAFADAPLKEYIWDAFRKEDVFVNRAYMHSTTIWTLRNQDPGPYTVTVEYFPDDLITNRAVVEIMLTN
jgi:hypothetical protein